MKCLSILAAAVFLALRVSAQNLSAQYLTEVLSDLPPCILPCYEQGVIEFNCADPSCICTSAPLQSHLLSCLETTCPPADQVRGSDLGYLMCTGIPVPSRNKEILNTVAILAAITYPIVALRYYQRWTIAQQGWLDDWIALITCVLLVAFDGICIASAKEGFGDHIWSVPPDRTATVFQLFWVTQILYILVQVFAKLSICSLYLRIFPRIWFQRCTKLAMALILAHCVAFTLLIVFQCTPIKAIWDRSIGGKCISLETIMYSAAAASIFEDFVILILPVPELNSLNLGGKKRFALIFMFSLGSFACVTSIIRLKYLVEIARSLDETWDNVNPLIWSIIEVHTALICACLPSLKSIFIKFFPGLFKSTVASSERRPQTASHGMRRSTRGQKTSDSYIWLPDTTATSRSNISAGDMPIMGVPRDEEKDVPLRIMQKREVTVTEL